LAAGGRIGSFNIVPWLAILTALAAVIGGSVWLRSVGQHVIAIVLLLGLAIPGALFVLQTPDVFSDSAFAAASAAIIPG